MGTNIERNKPCWCGSGKKLKHCHKDREDQAPTDMWAVADRIRKAFSSKYCLAASASSHTCGGRIVKAHTIQKSTSLLSIARDGHVYMSSSDPATLKRTNGRLIPKLVGINGASTFTGFCAKHDDSTFKELEQYPFSGSREQLFLLYYRAFCRELFMKRAQLISLNDLKDADRGKDEVAQSYIQNMLRGMIAGAQKALSTMERAKGIHDKALAGNKFNGYESYTLFFDSEIPIMCSGCIFPEYDFHGSKLQDVTDEAKHTDMIAVSSFNDGGAGVVSFTWHIEDSQTCKVLIHTFESIQDSMIADITTSFLFEFFENICIQPGWWENLTESQRSELENRMNSLNQPWAPRRSTCLTGAKLQIAPWPIRQRIKAYTLPW